MKAPSAVMPVPLISTRTSWPSAWRNGSRIRWTAVGCRASQRNRVVASRRALGAKISAYGRPISSVGSMPSIGRAASLMNVRVPAASVSQTRSGDEATR